MYKILKSEEIAANVFLMDIEAPRVAKSCMPGQFVICKTGEEGERIPLTICDYDRQKGSVTIIFQAVGASTEMMSKLKTGDYMTDFTGPLGKPSDLVELSDDELAKKKVLFVAGGIGAAPVYPQVKYFHDHNVSCDVILGSRTKELMILEKELKETAGNLYVCTDDGSYGIPGRVTDVINKLVREDKKEYDACVAIGPMIMMKFVCQLTKELNIPTTVSLNPIMVDGTGMCGACRVSIGDKMQFACVDGPEFDGFLVDFDEAMKRQTMYREKEKEARDKYHQCCGKCKKEEA